jgi:hypothetical protein
MKQGEIPCFQGLYMCYSRNAILRCIEWCGESFAFEYVFSMSQFERNRKEPGYVEEIHSDNLTTLFEVNEMEALALASR